MATEHQKEFNLTDEQVDVLIGFATVIEAAREAAGLFLGKTAVKSWGYPEGLLLGFNYNLKEKKVVVVEQEQEPKTEVKSQ